MARNYTDTPTASTTLAANFDSDVSATLTVTSSSGFPAVPFYAAIKRGLSDQQVIEVTGVVGTTWTVTPVSGSSPNHLSGSPVEHVAPAIHFSNCESHIDATTAHGSGSAIVGKDQSVTLTNKTMSGASNTFSNIPQSAISSLVSDLAAKATQAAFDAAFPLGTGAWTSYTPTLTQSATVTKTVNHAQYFKIGRLVVGQVLLTVTGTGTASNAVVIGLPVAAAVGTATFGSGYIGDTSAGLYFAGSLWPLSTTTVGVLPGNAAGTAFLVGAGGSMSAALASGDTVQLNFMYQSAS